MKLLVLDQFSDLGGAQQALAELLPALAAADCTGTLAMPGKGELFERARAAGFATARIECGPYRSGSKTLADSVRFAGDTLRLAPQLRRLARDADLIYVNGPRVLPAVALAGLRTPVVFHAHSLLPGGTVRAMAGAAVRRTRARLIASCEYVAKPWRAFGPRQTVIYNGVAGPPEPLWRGGTLRVGCIGRISAEKGQLDFVRAARAILHELPAARFVIHGAALFGDPEAARYEALVRKAAADLPIEFDGWTPDVYRALAGLDLLLVPSGAHEATTRVILEAYAAGVPVIAYRSGGIPEVVEHGVTGFLVDSAEQMANVAVECLRSGTLASISRQSRQCWERRFTQQRYHHELLDALRGASTRACSVPTPGDASR
jgi:glycosyltransferase involved in cell wall biosynthesis